jgi:hypothetical protein
MSMERQPTIIAEPWKPQHLLDDLQEMIDEQPDNYTNGDRTTLCMARSYLERYFTAEAEGRLVVLPCKVGDTVYEVQRIRKRVQPLEIISVYIGRIGELFFYWELKDGVGIYQNTKGFGASQLGKTVFLTREEAEAALEGGVENGR